MQETAIMSSQKHGLKIQIQNILPLCLKNGFYLDQILLEVAVKLVHHTLKVL